MAQQAGLTYLLIGNPGVGKSTILNGLLGKPTFKSGVNFGTGLTYQLDTYTDTQLGITYADTPGLADTAKCQQAAAAITKALRRGGRFRICFVIQLRQGRVSPEDAVTMKLVLDAAPITSYGIIINQVTPREHGELTRNPRGASPSPLDMVLQQLLARLRSEQRTLSVHIMMRDHELDGEDNAVKSLPVDLLQFMAALPDTTIAPEAVRRVRSDLFEEEREEAKRRFEELLKERRSLQEALRMTADEIHRLQEQAALHRQAVCDLQAQMQQGAEAQAYAQERQRLQAAQSQLQREMSLSDRERAPHEAAMNTTRRQCTEDVREAPEVQGPRLASARQRQGAERAREGGGQQLAAQLLEMNRKAHAERERQGANDSGRFLLDGVSVLLPPAAAAGTGIGGASFVRR